jgi:hypothetical protein
MGEKRNTYRLFAGKSTGKRPLGRPRCRGWIILTWILEREDGYVDWIGLAQDRDKLRALVNAVMNI